MIAALIENNKVVNMISVLPDNMSEFPNAIDPTPWGLTFEDYTTDNGETWYRDIDGVRTELPLPEPKPEETDQEDMLNALSMLGYTEE